MTVPLKYGNSSGNPPGMPVLNRLFFLLSVGNMHWEIASEAWEFDALKDSRLENETSVSGKLHNMLFDEI